MAISKEAYNFFTAILAKAKLNLGSEGETVFPKDAYKVYVHRDNPRLKTPQYLNVISLGEQFHVTVTTSGRLLQVKKYGTRKVGDKFSDITEKVKKFVDEPSMIGGKFSELGATVGMLVNILWKMTEVKYK